jgi:hypothetical protein
MKENTLTSISDLFGMKRYIVASNSRDTERGILLSKFSDKTGKPIGYIAMRLTKVPTSDLYHLEKACDNYKGAWSKCFFGSIKVK